MKILYKLTSAFLLMSLLLGFVGYTSYNGLRTTQENFGTMNEQTIPVITNINEMRLSALEIFSASSEMVMFSMHYETETSEAKEHEAEEISENIRRFNESFFQYSMLVNRYFPGESETRDELRNAGDIFLENSGKIAAMDASGKTDIFKEQVIFENASANLQDVLNEAILHEYDELAGRQGLVQEKLTGSLETLLICIWIFAATSVLGILSAYNISKSTANLSSSAREIGSGNLDAIADVASKDELGELASAFNKMAAGLKKSRAEILLRTREAEASKLALESRVKELTDTKTAMLNMMEDAENANKELVSAHDELSKNVAELKDAGIKKNEFMSIAAHELKTPMTSIHGFSQLLQNSAIANDAEKRNKYLAIMDHETKRLARLITDILDISRIDLNAASFDIEAVNLREVLDAVRTEMDVQIKEKGLKSEYIIDKDLPEILTDKERVTQILMNLINNAVKYTPRGKITVSAAAENNGAHFIIADTGIGISKKDQPMIFTRFYQVDSSYTRSAGGVGLGLSLCKEFIECLGGKIWFRSVAGKGSAFHFTLPKEPPKK